MPQPAARRASGAPVSTAALRTGAGGGARRRGSPRLRKRRLMRVAGALSLALVTVGGLSNVAMAGLGSGIGRVDVFSGLGHRPPGGTGQNFLVIGLDGRGRTTARERRLLHFGGEPCHCADTIMLAHLSADRSRLSVVSIPRDSYVRLTDTGSPSGRPDKLNAAYSAGGPKLTVRTVEQTTGIRVDHYLEMDFTGFMKAVDAFGGVPVCTARPLRDPRSGLDLPAGTTLLDGTRALQYVRARYLDGTADLGRMRRQQVFVSDLIARVTGSGMLLDPARLGSTVGVALDSMRADRGLETADLIRLTGAVAGMSRSSAEFASVPMDDMNREVPGVGTTVTWDRTRAARLFAAIRADRPLTARHRPGHRSAAPGSGPAPGAGSTRGCP
jgi:LCP family protein required for cell wall assembly